MPLGLAVLVAALGSGCTGDDNPVAARGNSVVTVEAKDNRFDPARIEIDPGTTVRWANVGHNSHNVMDIESDEFGVTTSKFGPGKVYTHRSTHPARSRLVLAPWRARGMIGRIVVAGGSAATPKAAETKRPRGSGTTIRVPADAGTIQNAVDRARPGDLVLVSPGVYREAVTIETDDVVLTVGRPQHDDPRR